GVQEESWSESTQEKPLPARCQAGVWSSRTPTRLYRHPALYSVLLGSCVGRGSVVATGLFSIVAATLGQGSRQHQVSFRTVNGMRHALGQGDFRQINVAATDQVCQVDFDGLRQVGGQAGHFQFGQDVADKLASKLDGGGNVTVDEVQGHFRRDGLLGIDALEVNVKNLRLVRVPLHSTQQYLLGLAAFNLHVENGSVEGFLAQRVVDFVVIELDVQWLVFAAVHNGGNTASVAKAAARTRTLIATRSGVEFHGKTPKTKGSWPW